MAILKCKCGKSMVVRGDTAGRCITCPICGAVQTIAKPVSAVTAVPKAQHTISSAVIPLPEGTALTAMESAKTTSPVAVSQQIPGAVPTAACPAEPTIAFNTRSSRKRAREPGAVALTCGVWGLGLLVSSLVFSFLSGIYAGRLGDDVRILIVLAPPLVGLVGLITGLLGIVAGIRGLTNKPANEAAPTGNVSPIVGLVSGGVTLVLCLGLAWMTACIIGQGHLATGRARSRDITVGAASPPDVKTEVAALLRRQSTWSVMGRSVQEKVDLVAARAEPLRSSGAVEAWRAELARHPATRNENQIKEAILLLLLAWEFPDLWKQNEFQADRSDELVLRMRKLLPEDVERWKKALNAATGEDFNNTYILLSLPTQDHLFEKGALRGREAGRHLRRIATVPTAEIAAWSEAAQTSEFFAVMLLLQVDSLFEDDVFRKDAFSEALEALRAARENP